MKRSAASRPNAAPTTGEYQEFVNECIGLFVKADLKEGRDTHKFNSIVSGRTRRHAELAGYSDCEMRAIAGVVCAKAREEYDGL